MILTRVPMCGSVKVNRDRGSDFSWPQRAQNTQRGANPANKYLAIVVFCLRLKLTCGNYHPRAAYYKRTPGRKARLEIRKGGGDGDGHHGKDAGQSAKVILLIRFSNAQFLT